MATHCSRVLTLALKQLGQRETQHRKLMHVTPLLPFTAVNFDIPDRLACHRVQIDDAIVLPGVKQPVILSLARNGLFWLMGLDPLAHAVGQALGYKPH